MGGGAAALRPYALYGELAQAAEVLIGEETDALANLANVAALVYHGLPAINWAALLG